MPLLANKAIKTFKVNTKTINESLSKNPILVTALNRVIGYSKDHLTVHPFLHPHSACHSTTTAYNSYISTRYDIGLRLAFNTATGTRFLPELYRLSGKATLAVDGKMVSKALRRPDIEGVYRGQNTI